MCDLNFVWGDVAGESFVHSVTCCYDEIVYWRKVLCGRAFVAEQARLFCAYAMGSILESVALNYACSVVAVPHVKSKEKDHTKHLICRLSLWNKGDIDGLVSEGRTLQSLFSKSSKNRSDTSADASSVARRFSQLMMSGKVQDVL